MKRLPLGGFGLLLLTASVAAQEPAVPAAPGQIDVKAAQVAAQGSLDALWGDYQRLDQAGDGDGAGKALSDIVRLRVERTIPSLEPMALALVAKGADRLAKGERGPAEQYFRGALGLDPYLADAYLGLAQAEASRGVLGLVPAFKEATRAIQMRLMTWWGQYRLTALLIPVALLGLLAATASVAGALLIQHGGLLLHDLEEEFSHSRGPVFARGLFVLLLLLPAVLLQGWAWLPLWWLALVFVYLNAAERVVAVALVLLTITVGPMAAVLERSALALRNPLFRPALSAVRGGPDPVVLAALEKARGASPDDQDLLYLVAREHRKAGNDEQAAEVYREVLHANSKDSIALNNLGNLDFAHGQFAAAIARYRQALESAPNPALAATLQYNISQAHLQQFEFPLASAARAAADKLSASLTRSYESLWRYDKAGASVTTVVDIALTDVQAAQKFSSAATGAGRKNVLAGAAAAANPDGLLPSALNRFLVFAAIFGATAFGVAWWRGVKLFTLRCPKCGTPFCKRCHLGQVVGNLCTQCYHLFVVKDGVSAQARHQKLGEVQQEEGRRRRLFHVLSVVSPGAGHVYARTPVPGLLIALLWYTALALVLLTGRPFALTEAPAGLVGGWALLPAGLLLLAIFLAANLWRPSFEVKLPVIKRVPHRRPAHAEQEEA
jgi:tetratricopeptide (TPR) repeat protein